MGFSLEKARECAVAYSQSTGIDCILIDTDGKIMNPSGCSRSCRFCGKIKSIAMEPDQCRSVHRYGSYQAERYGGKYIFFCPMCLVHWASPILENGILRGAFLGGPVHMVEPDEFLYENLYRRFHYDKKLLDELWKAISEVPVVSTGRVRYLSEMLFIAALHISDMDSQEIFDERKSQARLSGISEYIQYIKTMGGDETDHKTYPLEKEKELITLVAAGDKSGSQRVLNEILGYIFFTTGGNYKVLKARVLELVVLLSRAALEGGADVELIFGMNYDYLNRIQGFETAEELTFWLSKVMIRFTDCVFNLSNCKHADIIYKALDYIRHNYMNKITLEDVAAEVHLSPAYFSRVFNEEMKQNFNQYLNMIRIEHSKKLLNDLSLSIADISGFSGFEDQSYFTKVFKKITGTSPGRYRDRRSSPVK